MIHHMFIVNLHTRLIINQIRYRQISCLTYNSLTDLHLTIIYPFGGNFRKRKNYTYNRNQPKTSICLHKN